MKSINNFTRYLVDNGLLFEINRKVLHPLGLSLEADVDPNNRKKIILNKLVDSEDDEGFVFSEEAFEVNMAVLNSYMSREGNKKIEKRKEILGYVIQEE